MLPLFIPVMHKCPFYYLHVHLLFTHAVKIHAAENEGDGDGTAF
jgi:hypothetical protein